MSVIQKIRDKYAALVIALIALSLIAFILMDAFVGGRGSGGNNSTLGKVNGQKIDRVEFEKKITLQQTMYGQQSAPREELINSVWNMTVDELVMQQEYEKLGLQMGAKELNDVLFGANPPQWLKNEFTDQKTGQFNVGAAKQYFAGIKKQKANPQTEMFNQAYIEPTISSGLRGKYMALLGVSTYVPKWMAEKTIAEESAVARISYVTVAYSTIVDSTIQVSDDEVKAYMNAHKSEFKQDEAGRSISYVSFNAAPNGKDTAAALAQVENLKSEFANATEAEAYLGRVSSETPYFNGYVLGSKMQVPFADSIKNLANGQVYGPYVDATNYTLAKMIGKRSMPDSVKCRHILVKTAEKGQPVLPDSIAKARIDSVVNAIKAGADFNEMVLKVSDDKGSKTTKGEYDFASTQFPNLSKEFSETIFYGNTGDKKVVKVENAQYSGYHYIEVLEQNKIETAYNVAYLSKQIVASQETINTANEAASQFAATSRDKKSFEENAKKLGKTPMTATEIKQNDFQLGGVGESRPLIKWVYENKAGDISEPFDVNDQYVVAMVTSVDEPGMMSVAKARVSAEPFIRNEKKAQQIINTKLKSAATIEAAAQSAGVPVQVADSISFSQPFIPNVGNEPKVTGAAFNKALQGKVSEPIAGNTGVFVVKGESISAVPNTAGNAEDRRKQMEMQQKQMGSYRSMEALKKSAKIKDNRFDFF